MAREIGDRRGEGAALANLGLTYRNLGEVDKAQTLLQQALQIGRAIQDPQIVGIVTKALEQLAQQDAD